MPKTSHKKKTGREEKNGKYKKAGLARALWKGTLSFGLVNIPVRLYAALRSKDVRFHMLHQKDKSRIEQRIFCGLEQKEISREETAKGFEISPGQYVIVSQEELDALAPKASRTVELIQFIQMKEIDPVYFDRPYYLIPEEPARKAYCLLLEALRHSQKVGIAKFVMRNNIPNDVEAIPCVILSEAKNLRS